MLGNEINKINNQKDRENNALTELKLNYLTTIYSMASRGKGCLDIHREIFRETINFKKAQGFTSDTLYRNAVKLTRKATNKKNVILVGVASNMTLLATEIYKVLGADKTLDILSQNVYAELDKRESKAKNDLLKKTIKDNEEKNKKLEPTEELKAKIFYLCSTHEDSALDHKPYQGKMYVTNKWRSIIKSKYLKDRIDLYIARNDVKSFEWVIDKPVYMITRPNCRHYFNVLSVEEVLNANTIDLLNKYKMVHKVGTRDIRQTLKDRYINDLKSVDTIIAKYRERLTLHERLNKEVPTPLLREAIAKDKLLIAKWLEKRKTLVNTPNN